MSPARFPFEVVFEDESGGNIKTPQSEYLSEGRFPVVDQGKALIGGYVDDETRVCGGGKPAIIFGDHTRCVKYLDKPFCMGADGVKVLRPKIEADLKYLYHYLKQLQLPDAGYDRHFKYLKRTEVVLFPLPDQRRIAAILDKAEALRAKRREALAQLDRLAQAIFLEMFGDPVKNPMAWEARTLEQVTTKVTDGEHINPVFSESGMPIVMAGNVLDDRIDLEAAKKVDCSLGQRFRKKCAPEIGDLLIVSRGATIGRLCRVNISDPFCLMGSVILLKPNRAVLSEQFLSSMLSLPSMHAMLSKASGSSAQQAIYLKDVNKLACPLPPLALQQMFATRVQAIELLKAAHRATLIELNALFASVRYRAFRGEI